METSKEYLGLEERHYHYLCDTVDTIIHSAAIVNWVLPYSKLRSANVRGTMRIIQFAQTKRTKLLLHISSISSNITKDGGDPDPKIIPFSVKDGYGLSKYVSEEIIWECNRSGGVPVIVVSPGMVGPHRIYNHLNESQFFERYVRSVVSCGCVPKAGPWHVLEYTPVDYVSSIVTLLISSPKAIGKRFDIPTCSFGLSFLHEKITKKGYILKEFEDFQKWKERMKISELSPLLEIIDMGFFNGTGNSEEGVDKLRMVLCGSSTRDSYPTISPPTITEVDVMWWLTCMEERKLFGKLK